MNNKEFTLSKRFGHEMHTKLLRFSNQETIFFLLMNHDQLNERPRMPAEQQQNILLQHAKQWEEQEEVEAYIFPIEKRREFENSIFIGNSGKQFNLISAERFSMSSKTYWLYEVFCSPWNTISSLTSVGHECQSVVSTERNPKTTSHRYKWWKTMSATQELTNKWKICIANTWNAHEIILINFDLGRL